MSQEAEVRDGSATTPSAARETAPNAARLTGMSADELQSFLDIVKANDHSLQQLLNATGDVPAWRNALALMRKARE